MHTSIYRGAAKPLSADFSVPLTLSSESRP